MLPCSRARPLHHGGLNGREAENAAENIGHEHCARRRPLPIARVSHQRAVEAALRVDNHRIGGKLGLRAGLAVAGYRAIDQAWIDLAQRFIAETETLHHAGAEILDHNVRAFDHAVYEPDRLLRFEVEGQALLAGVKLAEIGALAVAKRRAQAHLLAFRRLDLDHFGADIRQQARAIRPGQHDGEIQHADGVER